MAVIYQGITEEFATDIEIISGTTTTACYIEMTYNTDKTVNKIDCWSDAGKTTKLFDKLMIYNANKIVTQIITRLYEEGILDKTVTDVYVYNADKTLNTATRTVV